MSISVKREKNDFIAYNKQKIADHRWALDFVNNKLRPIIQMFDGKVANVKIEREINSQLAATDKERTSVACELDYKYDYNTHTNVRSYNVKIKRIYERWNYNDAVELNLSFVLDVDGDKSPRINAQNALTECDNAVKYLTDKIDTYTDSVANYDEYMRKAEELETLIKEFNKINYDFRGNLSQYALNIYIG